MLFYGNQALATSDQRPPKKSFEIGHFRLKFPHPTHVVNYPRTPGEALPVKFPTPMAQNCELRGTDNVQGQISEHIFAVKLRLLCLLSIGFKNWGTSSEFQFWWS